MECPVPVPEASRCLGDQQRPLEQLAPAKRLELLLCPADADTHYQPSTGEDIQAGQLLCQYEWLVLRQEQDSSPQANGTCKGCYIGKSDHRI